MAKYREFKSFAELREHYAELARRLPPRENRRPEPPPRQEEAIVEVVEPAIEVPVVPEPAPEPEPVARTPRSHSDRIMTVVCKYFRVTPQMLRSERRTANIVTPRHYAMYLMKEDSKLSFPVIGRMLGHRDHTTVLHAIRKIESQIETDPEVVRIIEVLRKRLKK